MPWKYHNPFFSSLAILWALFSFLCSSSLSNLKDFLDWVVVVYCSQVWCLSLYSLLSFLFAWYYNLLASVSSLVNGSRLIAPLSDLSDRDRVFFYMSLWACVAKWCFLFTSLLPFTSSSWSYGMTPQIPQTQLPPWSLNSPLFIKYAIVTKIKIDYKQTIILYGCANILIILSGTKWLF